MGILGQQAAAVGGTAPFHKSILFTPFNMVLLFPSKLSTIFTRFIWYPERSLTVLASFHGQTLIAGQNIIYAQRMRVYCGLCLPSTLAVNWAPWTVNSIYCGSSLPCAGIHQDLGYRHLRPTLQNESILIFVLDCTWLVTLTYWSRKRLKGYSQNFFLLIKSHILDRNGVWYSSFGSDGSKKP